MAYRLKQVLLDVFHSDGRDLGIRSGGERSGTIGSDVLVHLILGEHIVVQEVIAYLL